MAVISMRQIEFDAPGGPDAMRVGTAPVPEPALGEVLIEVHFAGVNRPDVLQRQGLYPAPPGASPVLGLEVCGKVVKAAADVQWPREGESVCALLNGGGYAEFAVASAELCLPVPGPLSESQAAGLPEVAFTVWHNLFQRGRLTPGETVLVHGGASGIGSFAIQLAATLGCRVQPPLAAGTSARRHGPSARMRPSITGSRTSSTSAGTSPKGGA